MRRVLTAAITAAALLLSGCASGDDTGAAPEASASGAAYPVTVGNLTLEKRPERIVSLSPTVTEMLHATGRPPPQGLTLAAWTIAPSGAAAAPSPPSAWAP